MVVHKNKKIQFAELSSPNEGGLRKKSSQSMYNFFHNPNITDRVDDDDFVPFPLYHSMLFSSLFLKMWEI